MQHNEIHIDQLRDRIAKLEAQNAELRKVFRKFAADVYEVRIDAYDAVSQAEKAIKGNNQNISL